MSWNENGGNIRRSVTVLTELSDTHNDMDFYRRLGIRNLFKDDLFSDFEFLNWVSLSILIFNTVYKDFWDWTKSSSLLLFS